MMSAAIAGNKKMAPSEILSASGVMPEIAKAGLGCRSPLNTASSAKGITTTITSTAISARKISTRHPARMPPGPRNIVFGDEGDDGGTGGFVGERISGSDMRITYQKQKMGVGRRTSALRLQPSALKRQISPEV